MSRGEVSEWEPLDRALSALANPHRREIVYLLGLQPVAIHQLAAMRGLSLPAINKHIGVLEGAGFIARHKTGRTTFLTLNPAPLDLVKQWVALFDTHWGRGEGTYENYSDYLRVQDGNNRGKHRGKDPL